MDYRNEYLAHHGILNQKWGVKNGPPYPLKGGQYSEAERKAMKKSVFKNSKHNKVHFDKELKKGTTLQTLSYDKNRTKDSEYFYAAYDKTDIDFYRSFFNKKVPTPVLDEYGKEIGMAKSYKYELRNEAMKDLKIASEDSGTDVFAKLYSQNRDFYNFVTDPNRMSKYMGNSRKKFKSYREAFDSLNKVREGNDVTKDDLQKVYRLFNYVLPNDGRGNPKVAKDMARQRARFFKALGDAGYNGLLDINDALYGNFNANAPVIIFDTSSVVLKSADKTKMSDKIFSDINARATVLRNMPHLISNNSKV